MSGGDGKGHNSGAHATGGVNGHSGKGGPSSGGASDHSGWSSENNPWGGGGTIGGSHGGSGGNANHGNGNSVSRSVGDAMARAAGINPKEFTGYYLNSDGNVMGITSRVVGDAENVNLGPIKSHSGGGTGSSSGSSTYAYKDPVQAATENFNVANQAVISANQELQAKKNALEAAKQDVIKAQKEFDTAPNINPSIFPNQPSPKQFKHDVLEKKKREQNKAQGAYNDALNNVSSAQKNLEVKKNELDQVKDAVKFTADFYKEVFKVYGEKAEKLAKLLADQAKGKKIRNVEDALKSYEKYKANINKKINAKDREAIAKVLEHMDVGQAAKNIAKFSKGLGYTSKAIDFADWITELYKAIETDNWRPFFVKTESIIAGTAATALAGLAFSAILGGPVGVLGYGLIIAGVGALINDDIVENANRFFGI